MPLFAESHTDLELREHIRTPKDLNGGEPLDRRAGAIDCDEVYHHHRTRLKKIEATIRTATFDLVKNQLRDFSIDEITLTEVRSCRRSNIPKQFYRGTQYDALFSKIKV